MCLCYGRRYGRCCERVNSSVWPYFIMNCKVVFYHEFYIMNFT